MGIVLIMPLHSVNSSSQHRDKITKFRTVVLEFMKNKTRKREMRRE